MPAKYVSAVLSVGKPAGRDPWVWSELFDDIKDATHYGKDAVKNGRGSIAFVVKLDGENKHVVAGSAYPPSAANIIARHEELKEKVKHGKNASHD